MRVSLSVDVAIEKRLADEIRSVSFRSHCLVTTIIILSRNTSRDTLEEYKEYNNVMRPACILHNTRVCK